jgi:hypothetical protein
MFPCLPTVKAGWRLRFSERVRALLREKLLSYEKKGQAGRSVRVMVAGVPNVGKSSFINRLTDGARQSRRQAGGYAGRSVVYAWRRAWSSGYARAALAQAWTGSTRAKTWRLRAP